LKPAPTDPDTIALAASRAKGKRPWFMNNPEAEKVLSIAMAIAAELAVCRERLDTLERLLQQKKLLTREEIESYIPDRAAEHERNHDHRLYISRIMRILTQSSEALDSSEDLERIAEKLSRTRGGDHSS